MTQRLSLGLIAALAFATPQAAAAYERLPRQLASHSPADFARQVSIADDPQAPAVVLSTHAGYTRSRAIEGARADDVHMRALVDRRTGAVSWQVWHDLVYVSGRKDVTAIHYKAGGEPRQAQPLPARHWQDGCPPVDGMGFCNQASRIGFELPEAVVRDIAAAYRQGSRQPWAIRFTEADGRDVAGGLAPAEAAGLVQALDEWRRESTGRQVSAD